MAYKFQLGPSVLSGTLEQEGSINIVDDGSGTFELKVGGTAVVDSSRSVVVGNLFKMPDNTSGKFLVADGTSYQEVAMSGDATIDNTGALTIANNAVENAMMADDSVGAAELIDDSVGAAAMADDAVATAVIQDNAVTLAKMAGLARGSIILGDSSGDPSALAKGTAGQFLQSDGTDLSYVTLSGDATIAAGGALTISANAVEGSMINANAAGAGLGYESDALVVQVSGAVHALSDKVGISGSIAGAGLGFSGPVGHIKVLNVLTDDSSIEINGDSLRVKAAGVTDAMLNDDVAAGLAGDGLTASGGIMAVGVDDSSIEINSDALRLKDDGVTGAKLAPAVAGVGLKQDGSGNLDLDLNELSATAVDVANDVMVFIDTNDSNASKKVSFADLATALAGPGLSATDGVISTQAGNVTIFGDDNATLAEGMNAGSATLSADRTLTLPASPSSGDVIHVKAPASLGGNELIIQKGSADHRIDGQESIEIESDGGAVSCMFIGSNTWVIF